MMQQILLTLHVPGMHDPDLVEVPDARQHRP